MPRIWKYLRPCTLYDTCIRSVAGRLLTNLIAQPEVCATETLRLLYCDYISHAFFQEVLHEVLREVTQLSSTYIDHIFSCWEHRATRRANSRRKLTDEQTTEIVGYCFMMLMITSKQKEFLPFCFLNTEKALADFDFMERLFSGAAIEAFLSLHDSLLFTKRFERFLSIAKEDSRRSARRHLIPDPPSVTILDLNSIDPSSNTTSYIYSKIGTMGRVFFGQDLSKAGTNTSSETELIIKLNLEMEQSSVTTFLEKKRSAAARGLSLQVAEMIWADSTMGIDVPELNSVCRLSNLKKLRFFHRIPMIFFRQDFLDNLSSLSQLELGLCNGWISTLNEEMTAVLWNEVLRSLPNLEVFKLTRLRLSFQVDVDDLAYHPKLKHVHLKNGSLSESLFDWVMAKPRIKCRFPPFLETLTISEDRFHSNNLQNKFFQFLERCCEFVERIYLHEVHFNNDHLCDRVVSRFRLFCSKRAIFRYGTPLFGDEHLSRKFDIGSVNIPFLNFIVVNKYVNRLDRLVKDYIYCEPALGENRAYRRFVLVPSTGVQWNAHIPKSYPGPLTPVNFFYNVV